MTASGVALPLEIRSIEPNCIICFEELEWPIFCPQCKCSTCYSCLSGWFRKKEECPKCRKEFNLRVQDRNLYACPRDGKLVQFYCKTCFVCFCDSNDCQCRLEGHDSSHEVSSLDDLREEIKTAVKMMEAEVFITAVHKSLERFKKLLIKRTPFELVRTSPKLRQEINKYKQISKASSSKPTVNKNGKNGKKTVKRLTSGPLAKRQESTSGIDRNGNQWKPTMDDSIEECVIIDP